MSADGIVDDTLLHACWNFDKGVGAGRTSTMAVLNCACTCSMVKRACTGGAGAWVESSEPVSIMVSSPSSETSGELANKLALIRLALWLC